MRTNSAEQSANPGIASRNAQTGSSLLADACLLVLERIEILPRRMLLETPNVYATVPMLRGVWGAALHDLDLDVYHTVFEGENGAESCPPGYLLRPASEDPNYAPAIEWFLLGRAVAHDPVLCRAWDRARYRGLGPNRTVFHIRDSIMLGPDNAATAVQDVWTLADAARYLHHFANGPCRLVFPAPLRLRRHGRLIEQPTLPDIVVAAARRIGSLVPESDRVSWRTLTQGLLDVARLVPCVGWQGARLDFVRYSGRQRREVDLHGVRGSLRLPAGAGSLWPLLAASTWLHLGKGTVMGLGQLVMERG